MLCLDGNNSLKRLATRADRQTGDMREFNSDYMLPRDFVDKFAHEIKSRQSQPKPSVRFARDEIVEKDASDSEEEPHVGRDDFGDPTDGAEGEPNPCATNWKAAAANEKKHTWGVFEETGIFACCCRHGLILWIADMVRSGEQ